MQHVRIRDHKRAIFFDPGAQLELVLAAAPVHQEFFIRGAHDFYRPSGLSRKKRRDIMVRLVRASAAECAAGIQVDDPNAAVREAEGCVPWSF